MKCTRLKLSERVRCSRPQPCNGMKCEPRRYCQKRMVNPDHEEDPRWSAAALERFRCERNEDVSCDAEVTKGRNNDEEQFLSVLNLQFPGNVQECKRLRACFKYTSIPIKGNKQHRMFIKQVVGEEDLEESRLSIDPNFYDEYVSYIINRSESRSSTGKSSIDFNKFEAKGKDNKAVQASPEQTKFKPESRPSVIKSKSENKHIDDSGSTTKISFCNVGKRKSLTISRAQSPETVQVIRVDVVCNNVSSASSVISGEEKKESTNNSNDKINLKTDNFANKYFLTSTVKSLDQNICGGSKVTLLCKTFRLADRSDGNSKSRKKNIIHRK